MARFMEGDHEAIQVCMTWLHEVRVGRLARSGECEQGAGKEAGGGTEAAGAAIGEVRGRGPAAG